MYKIYNSIMYTGLALYKCTGLFAAMKLPKKFNTRGLKTGVPRSFKRRKS